MANPNLESKKKGGQYLYWCFTINNPEEHNHTTDELLTKFNDFIKQKRLRYAVFQREKGHDNTEHFQGYIQMIKKTRLTWMKDNISQSAHWENCNGNADQNEEYCTKEETRIAGPWRAGKAENRSRGKRTDWEEAYKIIEKHAAPTQEFYEEMRRTAPNILFNNLPNCLRLQAQIHPAENRGKVEIITIIGNTGTGKSTIADCNNLIAGTSRTRAFKPRIEKDRIWWCGYEGQDDVWFDDIREGCFTVNTFLNWMDTEGRAITLPTKGGSVQAKYTRIWITSNEHPAHWFNNMTKAQDPNNWKAICRRLSCDPDDPTKAITPNFIYIGPDGTREQLTKKWNDYCTWAATPEAQVTYKIFCSRTKHHITATSGSSYAIPDRTETTTRQEPRSASYGEETRFPSPLQLRRSDSPGGKIPRPPGDPPTTTNTGGRGQEQKRDLQRELESPTHRCCSCIDAVKELLKTLLRRRSQERQAGRLRQRRHNRPTTNTTSTGLGRQGREGSPTVLPPIRTSSPININNNRTTVRNSGNLQQLFRSDTPDPSTWIYDYRLHYPRTTGETSQTKPAAAAAANIP